MMVSFPQPEFTGMGIKGKKIGVTYLTTAPFDTLAKFLLPNSAILGSTSLEVLVLKRGIHLSRDTMIH